MNRRGFLIAGAAVALGGVVYFSVGSRQAEARFAHLPLSLEQMQADGALIVDIRTPPEWAQTGVIEGASLVTFERPGTFADSFMAALGDQVANGREIVLICRSGNRSQMAGLALAARVSNRVISVAGGMKRLMREGYHPVPVH